MSKGVNDTSLVGKNTLLLQSIAQFQDFRSALKRAPARKAVYRELHKLTLHRRAYRNIANIPLAMQTVHLGGGVNKQNVHTGTMYNIIESVDSISRDDPDIP